MASPVRSLVAFSASLLFLCVLLSSGAARAHPPHNPWLNPFGEDTKFAPITRFEPKVSVEVVADGMTAPLKGVAAPGLKRYLFVVDQPGIVWVVDLESPNPNKTIFLDVRPRIVTLGVCGPNTFDERGLLGIAFAPDFQRTGKFYTYTSERRDRVATTVALPTPGTHPGNADHHNVVAEWQANDPARPTAGTNMATRREILHANWPQFNHDGGDLAFGADGMLYISMGDGGGADDSDGQPFVTAPPHHPVCGEAPIFGHQGREGNGQRLNTTLGKILRINLNPPFTPGKQYRVPGDNPFVGGVVPEIWAYGLRNPYRFSFDRKTGDLYVGDVGQNDIEEVDIIKRGGNYGWSCKEGTAFFHVNGTVPDDGFASRDRDPSRTICNTKFINPIAQYDTHREGHSVVAGFVYHGDDVPALRGKYVFADFSLLFKFPTGPHDYGRLLTMSARGDRDEDRDHRSGLRHISELIVVPGGAISLAVLGMGQDGRGELYVTGNISGLPFPNPGPTEDDPPVFHGKVLKLVVAEDEAKGDHHHHGDKDD